MSWTGDPDIIDEFDRHIIQAERDAIRAAEAEDLAAIREPDSMQVNDIVTFSPRAGESAEGIVTRVWDKPASDPYVTIRTTEDESPRTFVRCASALVRA